MCGGLRERPIASRCENAGGGAATLTHSRPPCATWRQARIFGKIVIRVASPDTALGIQPFLEKTHRSEILVQQDIKRGEFAAEHPSDFLQLANS
jgi:hypothetical protein